MSFNIYKIMLLTVGNLYPIILHIKFFNTNILAISIVNNKSSRISINDSKLKLIL